MRTVGKFTPSLLLAFIFGAAACWGQNVTASITGVLKDPSGGVVTGAQGTARNLKTNEVFQATSSSDGIYLFRNIPVGDYSIEITAPGFENYKAENIHTQVNEVARVDITLTLGSVADTVTVAANQINVDTTSPTLKNVIDQRRIEQLPLNGRNATQLMRLVPGAVIDPNANATSNTTYPGASPGGSGGISVNGNRANTTNYILDGATFNDSYTNSPSPFPDPDALQEFSVQTNNFSAEFGRQSGGVVNAITKSGTNQVHGTAFEYVRNQFFNAANYFNPNSPSGGGKLGDGLKRNQFGGTIGGPVVFPKLYNGKDKTFFFFSYQGTLTRQAPFSSNIFVPTAAERNGDLSAISKTLKDPTTGLPFARRNQIPASELSPITQSILNNYIPLPTSGNYIYTAAPNGTNDNQYLGRIDQLFGESNRLSGRYFAARANSPAYLNPTDILENTIGGNWLDDSVAINDTQTFSPTLTNETLFGFNRENGYFTPQQPSKSLHDLGVNIFNPAQYEYFISVDGYFSINTNDTNSFPRQEYQALDTLRWTKGVHQIALGGEYERGEQDITNNYRANGVFEFGGSAPFTGDGLGDFLTGHFNNLVQGLGEYKNNRYNRMALFVDDTIKVSRRLTLDLGVRWEPFFPYTDLNGKLAVLLPGEHSTRYPNAPEGVLYAGDPGVPPGTTPIVWHNIAPRTGFAWDVFGNGKTSVRGGYGIFFDDPNLILTNGQADQAPFGTVDTVYGNGINSFANPYAGTINPFPSNTTPSSSAAFLPYSNQFLNDPNFRNPYVQSWNFTTEQALPAKFVLRGSYAGSKGTRLLILNQYNPAVFAPGATTSNTNQRRIFAPALGSTTLVQSVGNSTYHAMQWTIQRRFANGFTILGDYTFSKAIDDSSQNKGTGISRTNPFNQAFDKGPSDFDRTHVGNVSGIWDLPVHPRAHFANLLIGGWSLNLIFNVTSGAPFTVFSGVDNARTGQGNQRVDLTGVNPYIGGSRSLNQRISQYLNPAAFVTNALGTYGVLGRNTFFGPGSHDVDLGLYKDFPITERFVTTFRFEVFNALNTINLSNPVTTLTSTQFMQITSAGAPRILQFALRLRW